MPNNPISDAVIQQLLQPLKTIIARDLFEDLKAALPVNVSRKLNGLAANLNAVALGKRETYRANSKLASIARTATLEAYEANVIGGGTYRGPYRAGQNRESGKLLPALKNQRNYYANGDSLQLFDRQFLYAEAKHYDRLNFGASGTQFQREARSVLNVNIAIFGQSRSLQVRVGSPVPDYPNFMPRGGTVDRQGHYYPPSTRLQPYQFFLTRGIKGRHFLEAGVEAAFASIGEVYGQLPREWFLKASAQTK